MNKLLRLSALGLITAVACGAGLHAQPAATIFINGNVYTGDDKQPRAQAIAVKADRIAFVGSNDEVRKRGGNEARVIDLKGQTVVPGLTDAHCHIFGIGEREMHLNLEGTNTREEFLAKVKERVAQAEPGKWVTGRGWIETFWKPPQFPSAADLDAIAPDHPVFLERADGHAGVANSAALRIAAITPETPDPFGGEILKDKESGAPTGMLLDSAKELVEKHIPPATSADKEQALLLGQKRSLELGCRLGQPLHALTGALEGGIDLAGLDPSLRSSREPLPRALNRLFVHGPRR